MNSQALTSIVTFIHEGFRNHDPSPLGGIRRSFSSKLLLWLLGRLHGISTKQLVLSGLYSWQDELERMWCEHPETQELFVVLEDGQLELAELDAETRAKLTHMLQALVRGQKPQVFVSHRW